MPTTEQRSDRELAIAYTNGEKKCFETLLYRHKDRVFNYIQSIVKDVNLSEDIFQDTFIKVIGNLRRGNYNDEGKFVQWVLRIAHNLTIDYFRKAGRMSMIKTEGDFDIFSVLNSYEDSIEDRIVRKQIHSDIRFLIKQLPEEQRRVLILRHYGNFSFKEIAVMTGVSINTALGRMRYAIINMRRIAEEKAIVLSMK
ncbi:MAG: sigma-70 family RNA polymerase sigma factor [Bacteroidales bacterium]|jgi:RNA polymerase sigma-70 factor (ECF subfamily)|nr:sigma-70 family RNA polymerase sigma factor [Bacteroidales bacterium]